MVVENHFIHPLMYTRVMAGTESVLEISTEKIQIFWSHGGHRNEHGQRQIHGHGQKYRRGQLEKTL
jgi:hypothetical protein